MREAAMTNIRFNKTNTVGDDIEIPVTEVARQFWASAEGKAWLKDPSTRLERLALNWVPEHIGQWERLHEDWDLIFDTIYESMPRT